MSAITAKARRKMKKYAVLTREPRCFLGSFDFSWEQRKLGDMMNVTSVKRIHQSDWTDSGVRFLRARDIVAAAKNEEPDDYLYISKEKYEEYSALSGKVGVSDLLVTGVGTIGVPYLVRNLEPLYFKDGNIIWFQNSDKIDGKFLFYSFSAEQIQGFINESAGIGTVGTYTIESGKKTPISIPNQIEQAKVGEFFQQLDNLITLHQRKCANLCSPSQVVFSLLFATSTFSWEQRKLGDVVQITMGQSPDGSTYSDEPSDYILVQGNADLQNGWVCPRIWTTQITKKADAGDLIMSVRAPAGAMGKTAYNAVIGRGVAAIKGNEFIYQLLVKMDADGFWKTLSCGSTFESLNSDNIKNAEVKIPTTAEQIKIGGYFQQLDNLITLHQRECISFTGRADRLILTANKKRTTSSWEQRKLGELVDRVVRKNINNESTLPLTISAQYGLVDQITYFNNRVASRDVSNYYLVLNGEFAYNKSTSDGYPFGAVKRLDLYEKGVLSTLYIVFAPKKEQQIDSDYLTVFFDTDRWHKGVAERAAEGARNHGLLNISAEDFFDIDLSVPKDIVEQKQIGAFIRQLDNLITLHQRKLEEMKRQKKALMQLLLTGIVRVQGNRFCCDFRDDEERNARNAVKGGESYGNESP